jgi:hypothetical protein
LPSKYGERLHGFNAYTLKHEKISCMKWRVLWVAGFALVVGAILWLRLWISDLRVSAPHATLHMGETVQLVVARKTWLGTEPLAHPEQTVYITNWETMAVVEPDGRVTAVGTWGAPTETTDVMALNGKLRGSMSFSLQANGPGPSLDFIVDAPEVVGMGAATCCSTPVRLAEGQRARFQVLRHDPQRTDVTRRSAATRYTLFFGSGMPNDPNAARIVGYGVGINPATFRVDDENGMIVAPPAIGRLNYFTVLVFARNGNEVGWKQFKLVHATGGS